jgi:SPP1 family predicted phage head-tail adaptor
MSQIFQDAAGKYDRRVIFEQQTPAVDSFGQSTYGPAAPQGTWTEVITCWASINPLSSGNEKRESSREISEGNVMICVRYQAGKDLTTAMRGRDLVTGDEYDIRNISHVGSARREIELTCRVVV